jgi:protein-S-isoprenylcysteine O-methyltransferase Ste14
MLRHLPAIFFGLMIAFYWARVLRMARKARILCGHSANLIPKEPIGKVTRVIWFPVVALWIALPLVAGFGHAHQWWLRPILYKRFDLLVIPLQWLSAAIGFFALLATLKCWKIMGKSWRMGIDPTDAPPLVVRGPYAYLRHPIYAFSTLLMICTVIVAPMPLMIGVAIVHIILLQYEAAREERFLTRVHGEAYQIYCQGVGRFWPRTSVSTQNATGDAETRR